MLINDYAVRNQECYESCLSKDQQATREALMNSMTFILAAVKAVFWFCFCFASLMTLSY